MTAWLIRDASDDDVRAITAIYNALIPTHTVTWTEQVSTEADQAASLARHQREGFPVMVAEIDGVVVGFASYEHFRGEGKWPGYRSTAEHSIHVREAYWSRGVGRALMEGLIERARSAGIHVLVGAIDAGNQASLRFHARLGFVEVARMPETGQKFGRWLDLVLVQRVLDERAAP